MRPRGQQTQRGWLGRLADRPVRPVWSWLPPEHAERCLAGLAGQHVPSQPHAGALEQPGTDLGADVAGCPAFQYLPLVVQCVEERLFGMADTVNELLTRL